MVQSSGNLLIKDTTGRASRPLSTLSNYELKPLFPGHEAWQKKRGQKTIGGWYLAQPLLGDPQGVNPWDRAHELANAYEYAVYVEPDLLHEAPTSNPPSPRALSAPSQPNSGLDPDWPPHAPVSPGWHLLEDFTNFAGVRALATGRDVRIAHIDTGYWPDHISTPVNMNRPYGYNFFENNTNTTDLGTPGVLQTGHGTATLALLAGNVLDLNFGGNEFSGYFGGAPEAEVIPVRVGPSVVHLYTRTMAQGIDWATAPAYQTAMKCDVVTISHGGLPTMFWADAVNHAYELGITIVAASGDNFYGDVVDFPTRFTVYPSAFNRVITAVGATYDKRPYITTIFGDMQGNWGPDSVMEKAVAAYTPNIARMNFDSVSDWSMSFGGTSSSTPQIAAACALWLDLYGAQLPADSWLRVEAARIALFKSARLDDPKLKGKLGWGLLRVDKMLDAALAKQVIAQAHAGGLKPSPQDSVSFPFWRLLMGLGPPGSNQEQMYETEVAQVVLASKSAALLSAVRDVANGQQLSVPRRIALRAELAGLPTISNTLRRVIAA